MTEKTCKRCGQTKPLTDFHRNKRMKDGFVSRCKDCMNPLKRRFNRQNPGYYRKYRRKSRETNRRNHPEKAKARKAVENAVRQGRITKPERCEDCGRPVAKRDLHGHHEDYAKHLEVEWLCRSCHEARHRDEQEASHAA